MSDKMKTCGNMIIINDVTIEYGRVPNPIVKPMDGEMFFYFTTRSGQDLHDNAIREAANRLCDENDTNTTDWRIESIEKIHSDYYYQVSIVGIRIKDIY